MRQALIGAAAAALAAMGAIAQQEAWDEAMNEGVAAYQAQDFAIAASAFEQAIIRAATPVDEAEALRALGYVRFAQGQPEDTLALAERGVGLLEDAVEAGDLDAIEIAMLLWGLRAQTLNSLGRDEEGYDAARAGARLQALLPQPGWRMEEGAAVHTLSGFTCPATIEGLPRGAVGSYGGAGVDVGCNYSVGDGVPGLVSLYFTYRGGQPLEASVDAMKAELEAVYGSPRVIEDESLERADGVVRRVTYEKGETRLPYDFSAGWLVDVGGWTHKVRISWSPPLERSFVEGLAAALYAESTRGVWVGECAPATERAGERDAMTALLAASVAPDVLAAIDIAPQGGDRMIVDAPLSPSEALTEADGCWVGAVATPGGEIVVRKLRAPQQNVSHVAASLDRAPEQAWLAVSASLPLLPYETSVYVAEHRPDAVVIWASLDGPPSDDQLLEIVGDIASGVRSPLGSVTKGPDGNVAVSVFTDGSE